ncbi:MAG: nucleotidyltransferase family protein [Burkholderiales bacterium]
MRIAGILLAAGRGARFGGAKLLAPLPAASHGVGAGTAVGAAAAAHLFSALNDVVAAVRPGDHLLQRALEATGARVVACPRADDGMGASLACAVAAVAEADGWVIALGDMPWIAPATISAVADALRDGAEIAAPAYRGERGHPVGFARPYGPLLTALTGDEGARAIVNARKWAVRLVDVDDAGALRDVDHPADLAGGRK